MVMDRGIVSLSQVDISASTRLAKKHETELDDARVATGWPRVNRLLEKSVVFSSVASCCPSISTELVVSVAVAPCDREKN